MNINEIELNWEDTFNGAVASVKKAMTSGKDNNADHCAFRDLANWLIG